MVRRRSLPPCQSLLVGSLCWVPLCSHQPRPSRGTLAFTPSGLSTPTPLLWAPHLITCSSLGTLQRPEGGRLPARLEAVGRMAA